ncbi:Imm17 family immunity protein [Ruminococcus albus]|uniref:Imm17 family immunity protein n=1 Tax=Ruminococcus albus TaxID=1264 RepID=UPI0004678D30|nr:Imm17 family immunity protein [Ruminococcus albus]
MSKFILPTLILAVGVFNIFCACKDYDWFMNRESVRGWVRLIGRNGARVIYIIFGVVIILLAMFFYYARIFGVVDAD